MSEHVFVKELPWSGGRAGAKYVALYELLKQHPDEWTQIDEKIYRVLSQKRFRARHYLGVRCASRNGVRYASYSPELAAKEVAQ
jgi:hypothetical protein